MIITTDRLCLLPYSKDDLIQFHKLNTNEQVWNYSTNKVFNNIEQSETKLNETINNYGDNSKGFHALFVKETNEYIGEAGVLFYNLNSNRCTIGYNILPEFWNYGYATEISIALINCIFNELMLERIEALAMKNNIGSCKVLEKAGFKLEGILRHYALIRGTYEDVCYYGVIKSDLSTFM